MLSSGLLKLECREYTKQPVSEICSSSLKRPKLRTANVQRHRANAGCSSDQTVSDYYKVNVFFPFVDHVVQEVDSRFSQYHQGLILADRLSMAMSIDTLDQIEIREYYRKFLTLQESFYF